MELHNPHFEDRTKFRVPNTHNTFTESHSKATHIPGREAALNHT
jgi:hypothetical protein